MKKGAIPADFQVLIKPLVLFSVMAILAAVIYNVGVARISQQNVQVAQTKKNESILANRVSVLQEVSGTVTTQAKAADAAVPNINPGLLTLSQLKGLATKTGVSAVNFGIGSEIKDLAGLNRVETSIVVEGSFSNVVSFISQLNTIAPIAVPGKIRITSAGALSRASVTVSSYFAPLPTKLPSLTEPVTKLNSSEADIINKISLLTQPAFLELSPQSPAPHNNPF